MWSTRRASTRGSYVTRSLFDQWANANWNASGPPSSRVVRSPIASGPIQSTRSSTTASCQTGPSGIWTRIATWCSTKDSTCSSGQVMAKVAKFSPSSTISTRRNVSRLWNLYGVSWIKDVFVFSTVCYLGYGSPAKLLSSAIKKVISVNTELDCKNECIRLRETSAFKCLSFSFRYVVSNLCCKLSMNLLLFQRASFDLQLWDVWPRSKRIETWGSLRSHQRSRLLAVRVESIWLHVSR